MVVKAEWRLALIERLKTGKSREILLRIELERSPSVHIDDDDDDE